MTVEYVLFCIKGTYKSLRVNIDVTCWARTCQGTADSHSNSCGENFLAENIFPEDHQWNLTLKNNVTNAGDCDLPLQSLAKALTKVVFFSQAPMSQYRALSGDVYRYHSRDS